MRFRRRDIKELSDTELVNRFKHSKNTRYIGVLFDRYGHLVYGVCLKYLKNVEESKDAVHLIFEKVMKDLLRMEVKTFKPWLYMVSKNFCLMEIRKKKPLQGREQDIEAVGHTLEAEDDQETARLKELRLTSLEEAIEQLKPEQKKCIELFYLKEKSYQEVVELTGYELKKVKSYIQNGKRNLKIMLSANGLSYLLILCLTQIN